MPSKCRKDLVEIMRSHRDELVDVMEGDGEKIAEFIVKYLGPKYGIESNKLKVMSVPLEQGFTQYYEGVLYLNATLGEVSVDRLFNLIIHEFGHAIDDLAPQYGVIGRELNAYADIDTLYTAYGVLFDNKGVDMYYMIPTERSSHLLGDIVSGTTNYGSTPNGYTISKEIMDIL